MRALNFYGAMEEIHYRVSEMGHGREDLYDYANWETGTWYVLEPEFKLKNMPLWNWNVKWKHMSWNHKFCTWKFSAAYNFSFLQMLSCIISLPPPLAAITNAFMHYFISIIATSFTSMVDITLNVLSFPPSTCLT